MAFATALAVGSLAATGASTILQYKGQKEQARTAQSVAEFNAKLRENAAIQADMIGVENVRRLRTEHKRASAKQVVAIAKSGVTSTGSPLEQIVDAAGQMELAAQDVKYRADQERAAGFSEARSIRYEGASAAKGYKRAAFGTILSGAANFAGGAYKFHDEGAFG